MRARFVVRKELLRPILPPFVLLMLGCVLHAGGALAAEPPGLLTEITGAAGLKFVHDPDPNGEFRLQEIMGSGGAFLDFDNDGDLDVYLIQSAPGEPNRLFRQERDGRFTDVTGEVGGGDTGYGMGVAVGDIDNDGFVDLYVTNYGSDRLYRNEGGRRFVDATESALIRADGWGSSAVFCDYDLDGDLDLYVARYVRDDPEHPCRLSNGGRDYCSPEVFPGTPDLLYRNRGDGTFQDVSIAAGLSGTSLPGLGVICSDLNEDGRPDFYVANDGQPNLYWINRGDGTFREEAFLSGLALNSMGRAEAGMGIAVGDANGDGDADLFLTHLRFETNTLYANEGEMGFEDATGDSGLSAVSLPATGFGTGFFDLDHDGRLDLAVVNGRVGRGPVLEGAVASKYWAPYAEPNFLFRNAGGHRFADATSEAGDYARPIEISRGLLLGDVDDDGDVDLLVTNTAGPARLYRNDAPKAGGWLQVRVLDPALQRDAYGARVTVLAGGRRLVRWCHPGYGYLTSSDPRVHFGLPSGAPIEKIEVRWPDGRREEFPGGGADRLVELRRGEGKELR